MKSCRYRWLSFCADLKLLIQAPIIVSFSFFFFIIIFLKIMWKGWHPQNCSFLFKNICGSTNSKTSDVIDFYSKLCCAASCVFARISNLRWNMTTTQQDLLNLLGSIWLSVCIFCKLLCCVTKYQICYLLGSQLCFASSSIQIFILSQLFFTHFFGFR